MNFFRLFKRIEVRLIAIFSLIGLLSLLVSRFLSSLNNPVPP